MNLKTYRKMKYILPILIDGDKLLVTVRVQTKADREAIKAEKNKEDL